MQTSNDGARMQETIDSIPYGANLDLFNTYGDIAAKIEQALRRHASIPIYIHKILVPSDFCEKNCGQSPTSCTPNEAGAPCGIDGFGQGMPSDLGNSTNRGDDWE